MTIGCDPGFDDDGACGACCPGFVDGDGNAGAGGAPETVPGILLDCLSLICCKYFLFFFAKFF